MYTAQANAHGNVIVCRGDRVRISYQIVFRGTYQECLAQKGLPVELSLAEARLADARAAQYDAFRTTWTCQADELPAASVDYEEAAAEAAAAEVVKDAADYRLWLDGCHKL